MKTTAYVIAEWFIAHNDAVMKYNSADEISNLKIQKLLYYAQECALASLGEVLFKDDIVAWEHGPVVEGVYQKYYEFGRKGISVIPDYPLLTPIIEDLLINTYNYFAKYSAWELANLTYGEDPWKLTPKNSIISIALMRNYFKTNYSCVNAESKLTDNLRELREISQLGENWDEEGGLAYGNDFIKEVIDLVSTMKSQPDIGATGRGSLDFEFGSFVSGNKYMDLELYENGRKVHAFRIDSAGTESEDNIGMEDVNSYVQHF